MKQSLLKQLPVYTPEKPLEAVKRQYHLQSLVRLSANESQVGPSPRVKEAILKTGLANLSQYPDGNVNQLRAAVANQYRVAEDQLVFGNGLDEVIEMLCRALVAPGDEIVQPSPTFFEYQFNSKLAGGQLINVDLDATGTVDLAAVQAAITLKTRLVWLCNPNNPTGTMLDRAAIERFMAAVPERVFVIVDEAYIDFAANGAESLIQAPANIKNLVVLRTFSKAYGLANLRVGFAVCQASVANLIQSIRLPYNLSTVAEVAATAAVSDQQFLETVIAQNAAARAQWERFLTDRGLRFYRSQTNFVFFEVAGANELAEWLLKNGYQVRTGLRDGWVRISFGSERENEQVQALIEQFLNRKGSDSNANNR